MGSLFRSIRRVTAWQLHKLGHILDPGDSFHGGIFIGIDKGAGSRERVLSLIEKKQPMPWANLLYLSQMPAAETRDAVQDLIDEGLVTTSSLGLIIIDSKEDHD